MARATVVPVRTSFTAHVERESFSVGDRSAHILGLAPKECSGLADRSNTPLLVPFSKNTLSL